jgi:hypothetical protein
VAGVDRYLLFDGEHMTPNTIQFSSTDSTWVMRITADRRIEVNEDVEVTEAAQKVLDAMRRLLAAQPAVPDAFGTREGEHPQYIQGWNDCRAEMLRGMK